MGPRTQYKTLTMLVGIYDLFWTRPFIWAAVQTIVPAPRVILQLADLGFVEATGTYVDTIVWAITPLGVEKVHAYKEKFEKPIAAIS